MATNHVGSTKCWEKADPPVEEGLAALRRLHSVGWSHGDPRPVNTIKTKGGGVLLIDLSDACPFGGDTKADMAEDVGKFVCGLLRLSLPVQVDCLDFLRVKEYGNLVKMLNDYVNDPEAHRKVFIQALQGHYKVRE